MGALEIIGLIAVIYFIYHFVIIPRKESTIQSEKLINEKVYKLKTWHPEIKKMFRDFEKRQKSSLDYVKEEHESTHGEYYYGDKGSHVLIFGISTFVFYKHEIEKFENDIINKIEELETSPFEKDRIDKIITKHNAIVKKQEKEKEIELLGRTQNYLKYGDLMNVIFKNEEIKLNEDEILKSIQTKMNISVDESKQIFSKITDHDTGLIFKINNCYWYNEDFIRKKINQ